MNGRGRPQLGAGAAGHLDVVGLAEWTLQIQSTPCACACLQVIFCEVIF